jgi:tetratricopeptide (TPR) repeat protein
MARVVAGRLGPAVVAAVVCGLAISAARAEPAAERRIGEKERQRARALYDEGARHYNVAEYPAAIEAWKSAYLLSGDPKLLFDVAQAYRLSGDCEQALRFYRNFLREHPHASNEGEVESAIARCEAAAAPAPPAPAAPVEPPAPAPIVSQPPPPAPVAVPIEVDRSTDPPPREPGRNKRVGGVAVALVGLAAAGTGVALGLAGRAKLDELHGRDGEWGWPEARSEQSAQRMATTGQILTAAGAAGVAAGVALYLVGAAEKKPTSRLALAAGPGHAQVVWSCGF